jgi:hypothetical protein
MTEWLAVIVICAGGECAFWASIKEPINSRQECERLVEIATEHFNREGIETPVASCLPIRWIKA